jgi:hypothetical protein
MTEPTPNDIIGAYVSLRSEKDRISAEYKANVKVIDDKLKKLEVWLQMWLAKEELNSVNSESGTAYKTTVEQATVSDMTSFIEFVKENEAWHLLEKRVSKTGIREMLDADEPIPPGVNWYVTTAINVRKPNER